MDSKDKQLLDTLIKKYKLKVKLVIVGDDPAARIQDMKNQDEYSELFDVQDVCVKGKNIILSLNSEECNTSKNVFVRINELEIPCNSCGKYSCD